MVNSASIAACAMERNVFVSSAKKVIKLVEEEYYCTIQHSQIDGALDIKLKLNDQVQDQRGICEEILELLSSAGINEDVGELLELPSNCGEEELEMPETYHPNLFIVFHLTANGDVAHPGIHFVCAASKEDAKAAVEKELGLDYPDSCISEGKFIEEAAAYLNKTAQELMETKNLPTKFGETMLVEFNG